MNPKIFGKSSSVSEDRSDTFSSISASVPFQSGTCGRVNAEVFISQQKEDRGGIVIRITADDSQAFIPYAKNIEGGIELHMAGDAESEALVDLLRGVLSSLSNDYHQSSESPNPA